MPDIQINYSDYGLKQILLFAICYWGSFVCQYFAISRLEQYLLTLGHFA